MKVAVTGAAGLLGGALVEVLSARHGVIPLTRAEADITDAAQVHQVIAKIRPDVIVHTAAIREPDASEAEPARAFQVNVHGTRNVAEAAHAVGAAVAYISTDLVFDGKQQVPYKESDRAIPLSVYGRTKLRGERIVQSSPNHWVFRVSLLFGPGGDNLLEQVPRAIAAGEDYEAASDQEGSTTYTLDAARKILEVVETEWYGLYHLSNQGVCSRLDIAQLAAELAGLDRRKVIGRTLDQMARRAPRPKYHAMKMAALQERGFSLPRPWREAVAEYFRTRASTSHAQSLH